MSIKYVTNMKSFKKNGNYKSQLQPLDIVKLRNGNIYFIAYNSYSNDYLGLYAPSSGGCFAYVEDYNNELTDNHENNKENDIIAIYRGSRQFAILDLMFSNEHNEEIEACIMRDGGWTLEINNIKKMTLEDIEKALGYKFELI